jgi:hypothetical protein
MPAPKLPEELLIEAVEVRSRHETVSAAADELGIPRSTLTDRLKIAAERSPSAPVEFPEFPTDDIPIDEIIDSMCRRYEKRKAAVDAHTWFPIKFKEDCPIGIVWFGDPHVDDNGCNWPLLRSHVELCQTKNVYGVNIGDSTNNWVGRLMKLYAEQDTSISTARRLAEWLMLDSGIQWLVWLLGNHDCWNDGAEVLAQMGQRYGTRRLVCHDWEARFTLQFPGWEPRIYAAHDFKGHSMWNPLHGPMKEGQMGEDSDIYVCGHRHNFAMFSWENARRGSNQTFIRVRGYKELDSYARRNGFPEQEIGAAVMTVFDPQSRRHTSFSDPVDGVKYLKTLEHHHEYSPPGVSKK